MIIFRNAEGVHGQRKVGNPCPRVICTGEERYLTELSVGVHKMLNRIGRTCISLL